ncbi:hypothetical protein ABZ793_23810 [Micromonospora sp. NPDC047465]|uniref:hypothetical protein n=1 Tax=Micromonospora sp. NPDC047465 TaxID=3154813 RepID=UPI0033FEE09E
MYQANLRRDAERAEFGGPDEAFLCSLDLELRILRATEVELSRVEELTLCTSQMNATGVHYSDETLRRLLVDEGHDVLVATLTDRFGAHGAIGVLLVEQRPTVWHLKLLATSCQVVSFGVGAVILNWLAGEAAAAGAHLLADFRRTERNRMMEIAYRFRRVRRPGLRQPAVRTRGRGRRRATPAPAGRAPRPAKHHAPDHSQPRHAGTSGADTSAG